jgi:hypothetical protein
MANVEEPAHLRRWETTRYGGDPCQAIIGYLAILGLARANLKSRDLVVSRRVASASPTNPQIELVNTTHF